MTTIAPPRLRPRLRPFALHLGEMVVAMVLGMLLLAPLWDLALPSAALARPDVGSLIMATNMTAAMTLWMWHRGHGGAALAEMAAAMYLPFLVLLLPWWAGLLPGGAVLPGGHVLMLPAMVWAAWRHRHAAHSGYRPMPVGLPSLLALIMTLDNWVNPGVPGPWLLLVLPAGYLLIGAWRRTLRADLPLQFGQLAAYVALAAAAAGVGGDPGRILIGLGWLAHAAWDLWHHRRDRVVPRGYAEWCAVIDVVIGGTVLLLAV